MNTLIQKGQTEKYYKVVDWVATDQYRILYHILFWMFFYSDVILSFFSITDYRGMPISYFLLSLLIDTFFVYFNLYYLIPKYLLKNNFSYYIFFTIITVIACIELKFAVYYPAYGLDFPEASLKSPMTLLVRDLVDTGSIVGMAVGLHMMRRYIRSQEKVKNLEMVSLKTELAFLKHQINPHFLFNSLNNIYVQSRRGKGEASESILQLSDLLRYQLYDCAKDKVYLKGEIAYLKNYLKLDKLRRTGADIEFELTGDPGNILIAPFLFIPFVENAVKHGMTFEDQSFIKMRFVIEPTELYFEIENSKPKKKLENVKGGIGLSNVKRRLDLLYTDKHDLLILDLKDSFKVELKLFLD